MSLFDLPGSSAVISECGRFRYRLTRTWDAALPARPIVMLNPSKADATDDDATIRKCVGFARRDGYGGIIVGNLWAYRATDPGQLRRDGWQVGPDNDEWLARIIGEQVGPVLVAWGAHAAGRPERVARFVQLLADHPWVHAECLGRTKGGLPRHPLMVSYAQPLVDWGVRFTRGRAT